MSASHEDISKAIVMMEKSCANIEKQCFDIAYFMKGGMTLNEVWCLSFVQREMYTKDLNDKIRRSSGDTTEYM